MNTVKNSVMWVGTIALVILACARIEPESDGVGHSGIVSTGRGLSHPRGCPGCIERARQPFDDAVARSFKTTRRGWGAPDRPRPF